MAESKSKSKADPGGKTPQGWSIFRKQVKAKASRKVRSRQEPANVWFGLGMFGMVGWSVAIPSLLGIAAGVWVDLHIASPYSWTLMLMLAGVGLGCLNTWYWIQKESQQESE